MKQNRILLCAMSFLMIFNILVPVLYAQQRLSEMSQEERSQKIMDAIEQHRKEKDKTRHPKVSHVFTDLEDEYNKGLEDAAKKFTAGEVLHDDNGAVIMSLKAAEKKGGVDAAKKFAKSKGLQIIDGDKVRVRIILEDAISPEIFDETLQSYGGRVVRKSDGMVTADIPIDKIRKIADEVVGIRFITSFGRIKTSGVRSEGLSKVGFSNYSAANITGSGVKVAVIDSGFKGLSNAINNGDLPANVVKFNCATSIACQSTTFPSETDEHGTAVAEIVHDMAPEAQLYLLKIDEDTLTLKNAATFSNNTGVKVINHSVNWYNETFYDGSCYANDNYAKNSPVCTANTAKNNGILWINSVGNDAFSHYEATYSDGGGYYHTTLPTVSATAGQEIILDVTWNAWPATNQDYDIYLFDDWLGLADWGEDRQTGSQPPKEEIKWTVDMDGIYYLYIIKYSATSNHKFEVFSMNHVLNLYDTTTGTTSSANPYSSVSSPADASSVMAVGYINYGNWTTGPQYTYSSQGPINNSTTIKPDIMGPDKVSTYTYGGQGFEGTSAAAPHVAGAAALLLSQDLNLTVSQLWNTLTSSATDMGSTGQDNIYGYGRLNISLYNLNISKSGTGSGTVTSSPSGISCGSDCTESYLSNTSVTLTATADSTSNFAGWSGACSGTGSCTVTMNSDTSVTASFDLPTLTVSKTGIGTGTVTSSPSGISCGSDCTQDYNKGTSVTLTATADPAWDFVGWSGSCSGTGSCAITMSSDTSATAGFACLSPTVKIFGKAGYPTIQAAYNAAAPGDIIQARAITFAENVIASRDIPVTISGGFDCHFSSSSGTTILKGQLTTSSGLVAIRDFNLQY